MKEAVDTDRAKWNPKRTQLLKFDTIMLVALYFIAYQPNTANVTVSTAVWPSCTPTIGTVAISKSVPSITTVVTLLPLRTRHACHVILDNIAVAEVVENVFHTLDYLGSRHGMNWRVENILEGNVVPNVGDYPGEQSDVTRGCTENHAHTRTEICMRAIPLSLR